MAEITQEEIKRLKGLGCLKDKRFEDVFNVRVPLGIGKISTKIQRVIADAADKFGSGEVALTTRLTYEIQGVKYENIEGLIAYLAEFGLQTGGTGPKVRPVVCCKGTTCTFGLIDTYGLAEKVHERFYVGMHQDILPAKLKIGIGGCPNNCVKPNLNDIGIRGTVVPKEEHPSGRAYMIFLGGHWGKKGGAGVPLAKKLYSEEETLDMIEKIINFYKENGQSGERLFKMIDRIGFDNVEKALFK